MTRGWKKGLGAVAGVAVALLTVFGLTRLARPAPVMLQGEVEATQIDVAAKIAGRVDSLCVREGDTVRKGQLLAVLASPEIQAKRTQATSARRAADAQRDKAENGTRVEEVRAARALWEQARAAFELADKTAGRVERLQADGIVPLQRQDEARAQRASARSLMESARARYDMALAGARSEDRSSAEALADQAAGVVSEVDAYLGETRLLAPTAGEVAERVVDPGELVAPGYPLLTLVDLSDSWVTFQLREDRLDGLRMGARFEGTVPALGRTRVTLVVSYIAPLGDFATWRATNELGDFDRRTFEVRMRPTAPLPGLRPGMSVLVPWPGAR